MKWEGDLYNTLLTFCNVAVCGAIFGTGSQSTFKLPFLKLGDELSASKFKNTLRFVMIGISPKIYKWLGIKFITEHEDFLMQYNKLLIRESKRMSRGTPLLIYVGISLQRNGTMKDETTGCDMEPTTGLLSA